MMSAPRTLQFQALNDRMATLSIGGIGDFGLHATDDRWQGFRCVYGIGPQDRPPFKLAMPQSPDDAILVTPQSICKVEEAAPPAGYLEWSAGSRAVHGHNVLQCLPQGRYLLARTSLAAAETDDVLLGNERQGRPPHMRVLLDSTDFHAFVVGARPQTPPALNQPIIGLAILNYCGTFLRPVGLPFLPFSSVDDDGTDGDLVLVIPRDGDFVIDNMRWGEMNEVDAASLEWWQEEGAFTLQRVCAQAGARVVYANDSRNFRGGRAALPAS